MFVGHLPCDIQWYRSNNQRVSAHPTHAEGFLVSLWIPPGWSWERPPCIRGIDPATSPTSRVINHNHANVTVGRPDVCVCARARSFRSTARRSRSIGGGSQHLATSSCTITYSLLRSLRAKNAFFNTSATTHREWGGCARVHVCLVLLTPPPSREPTLTTTALTHGRYITDWRRTLSSSSVFQMAGYFKAKFAEQIDIKIGGARCTGLKTAGSSPVLNFGLDLCVLSHLSQASHCTLSGWIHLWAILNCTSVSCTSP
jgi:hypothetical protein